MTTLKRNLSSDELVGIGLFISSVTLLSIMLTSGLNRSLNMDEVYTLRIIDRSFTYMVFTTAADVHPPLYYAILMGAFKLFSPLSYTFNIVFAKLVSVVTMF
ncbi:MAG: hypothetical protein LBC39_05315 [Methanobrevibacter sp.]|jgi:hypothetical protein|nr:hypothetical protein [Candidatus Methanovirga aequatorialis]